MVERGFDDCLLALDVQIVPVIASRCPVHGTSASLWLKQPHSGGKCGPRRYPAVGEIRSSHHHAVAIVGDRQFSLGS